MDVHLDDGKEGLDFDLDKVTRVRYDARREMPEPGPAFLRIEIADNGTVTRHVLKGGLAERAWRTLLPAARRDSVDWLEEMSNRVSKIGQSVEALLRFTYVDRLDVPYPEKLVAKRARFLSNDEDDGMTLTLFAEIGAKHHTFVEMACGTNGGNSGFLALECGWSGLMIDADPKRLEVAQQRFRYSDVRFAESFITRENVNELLEGNGMAGEIDLLSVDVDGIDYWLWDAITVTSPRVVIIEINSYYGPDRSVVIPYDPAFDRHNFKNFYYGASIQAMTKMAARKGYRLVATEPRGHNAYFLRADVATQIPALPPADAWRLHDKYEKRRAAQREDIFDFVQREGIQLVEVE